MLSNTRCRPGLAVMAMALGLAMTGAGSAVRAQTFEQFCGSYGPGSSYYEELTAEIRSAFRGFRISEAREMAAERRGIASCCRRVSNVGQRSCLCNNPVVPSSSAPDTCLFRIGG